MKNFFSEKELPPLLVSGFYIVATPIGNREDMTLRGLRVLQAVDVIVCENKEKSLRLLQYYGIKKPLQNYRAHRLDQERRILAQLAEGKNLAYITDAGTPGIQDPVATLIRKIRQKDICEIVPIPGASALTTVLSISGMQTNPSLFLGYLSPRPGRRRSALKKTQKFPGILILYESPHRVHALLQDMAQIFSGEARKILIARELTKIHEEILIFPLEELEKNQFQLTNLHKGEFTLVLGRDM